MIWIFWASAYVAALAVPIGMVAVVLLILDKRDQRYWQRKNDELDSCMVDELMKINDQIRVNRRRLTSRWN